MKIAILAHSFPPIMGGGESHVYSCAKRLSEKSHEVSVITSRIPDDFLIKERPQGNYKIFELPYFKEYELGQMSFKNILVPLYNILNEIKPDIIHVHNMMPFLVLSYIGSLIEAKICFTYHSTPVPSENKILGYFNNFEVEKSFAKFIFGSLKYDCLICPSKYYYDWALVLGSKKNKTKLVYHGVDTELFYPRENREIRYDLGYKDSDFIVCTPVRLIKRKGILDILEAASLNKNARVRFLILTSSKVPDPNFLAEVLATIKKLGIEDKLKIVFDKFSHEQMPDAYSSVDLVLLPSHYEGLGLVLLEAMACGKVVIGTKTSGIIEVIKNAENGLLINPRSPSEISITIDEIVGDGGLQKTLIDGGLQSVKSKFNLNRQINELEKIYESSQMEKDKIRV